MNDTDPRCCCKNHGQRLCPLHQPLFEGFWAALILALGLACGGDAVGPQEEPFGWECEGFSGLTARDAEYFEVCTCEGIELAGDGVGRGECVKPLTE